MHSVGNWKIKTRCRVVVCLTMQAPFSRVVRPQFDQCQIVMIKLRRQCKFLPLARRTVEYTQHTAFLRKEKRNLSPGVLSEVDVDGGESSASSSSAFGLLIITRSSPSRLGRSETKPKQVLRLLAS